MKTLKCSNDMNTKTAKCACRLFSASVTFAVLVLVTATVGAALSHAPLVSWVPDQRITNYAQGFTTQYFRIIDHDAAGFTVMKQSSNPTFYSASNVSVVTCTAAEAGCAPNNGWKVSFPAALSTMDGSTTITIRAKKIGSNTLIGYMSFTLRLDSTDINPPSIGNLPNYALPLPSPTGSVSYKTTFVVGDLNESGEEDIVDEDHNPTLMLNATSSNHDLLLDSVDGAITFTLMPPDDNYSFDEGPRSYILTANTIPGATGQATVTVDLTDPDGNTTSTSFILQVVDTTNAQPSISNTSLSFEEQVLPATSLSHSFSVTNDGPLALGDLKVTANSSNTKLVPNDSDHLFVTQPGSNGIGSVTITPLLPLPSPSPGVPQSSTVTLSVADDAYLRQTTFLYVVTPGNSAATSFSRISGVYSLRPMNTEHRPNDSFLTGELVGISWNSIETAKDVFSWNIINDAIDAVPPSVQDISLNLQGEPCYVAAGSDREYNTWCDTDSRRQKEACGSQSPCPNGVQRAVPWDGYLQARWANFIQLLAQNIGPARMQRITIINPNLPGGDAGIRNVVEDFDDMDGYTREHLLAAVQWNLRTIQNYFPGKLVQIGLFKATDGKDSQYDSLPLWKWLYRDASVYKDINGRPLVSVFDEFNGIRRPRVSFFQENLAATRTSVPTASPPVSASNVPNYFTPPSALAYGFSPLPDFLPSFTYYTGPTNDQYNNGVAFQANVPWTNPFMNDEGLKLIRTINGSPNDAMEGAFNAYLSQYLEVYPPDIDHAKPYPSGLPTLDAVLWEGQLKSWRDYAYSRRSLAPIEGPAGLTVVRNSSIDNTVSWFAVYGADTYSVEKRPLGGLGTNWQPVNGCTGIAGISCPDTTTNGSAYAYRVKGTNSTSMKDSNWSYVAMFLSESTNDGVTSRSGTPSTYGATNNLTQPGIRAGEPSVIPLAHYQGIVSFNTGVLGSTAIPLSAKFRLKQWTLGTYFGPTQLGDCLVDIKKGSFNGNAVLEGADYTAIPTTANAFSVVNVFQNNWFLGELVSAQAGANVNTDSAFQGGRTQFRIHFNEGTAAGHFEGWYSGESADNEPQLIVQYQP